MVVMTTSIAEFLSGSLQTRTGHPMRVALYARIADGIRSGVFPLGSLLPRETELGAAVGVSRTVVREALMLLEEDGLVVTRRGVGRFVADRLPEVGLEEVRAFEDVLSTSHAPLTVRPGELELQTTTPFVSRHLGLDDTANTWFCESIMEADGRPLAIIQEHLPAGRYLSDVSPAIAENVQRAHAEAGTLFAALVRLCGPIFTSGVCEVAANVVGATRAKLLDLGPTSPALILTQTARVGDRPVYLAKCIVSSEVGHLQIIQSGAPS